MDITVAFIWDVYHPTPGTPLYTVKDTTGKIHLVKLNPSGQVIKVIQSNCREPEVIHGVDPNRPSLPMDFGKWIPLQNWTIAYYGI